MVKKKSKNIKTYGWGSNSIWSKIGFHKTIHFKTLKQYNDFLEHGRLLLILYKLRLFGPFYSSPISISLKLTKLEDFNQAEIERTHDRNLDSICKEVKANLGRSVRRLFDDKTYLLEGLELTHEDYYYILKEKDGHKAYQTCCAGIKFI